MIVIWITALGVVLGTEHLRPPRNQEIISLTYLPRNLQIIYVMTE